VNRSRWNNGLAAALASMIGMWALSSVVAAQEEGAGGEQLAGVYSGIPHDAVYGMVINGTTGYAVGAFGAILETKDSGASWAKMESGTDFALLGLAVNGDKRIIVGQRGTVLVGKSDGGWEPGTSGSEARLMQVSVNSSGLAVAVGEFGTVLRSKDAGKTWDKRTLDWASFREDGYEPHIYAVNVDDTGRIVLGAEFSYVIVSTDGGETWTLATKGEKSIFSMQLLPDGSGYAVGQEGLVMKTADAGNTWQAVDVGSNANLFGVWFQTGRSRDHGSTGAPAQQRRRSDLEFFH
jgi:photosystem II stability/assembly factor-like uncharacterized protein